MDAIRKGKSSFVFANNAVVKKALMGIGEEEEDAADYTLEGCYEPASAGREFPSTLNGRINLPMATEVILGEGRNFLTGDLLGWENKLDYDDFESLAGIELSKAMKTFDSEKSNLFTYATRVITQKAKTELRNCTQRDRRKALYVSESIDYLSEQEDISPLVIGGCFTSIEPSQNALSDKMITYLNKLSKLQRQVLFAMAEGYSNDEIKAGLNITSKELSDTCAALRSYRNVSLLY
jgi:RNA polymerase sigma factor (sigma-70 family)